MSLFNKILNNSLWLFIGSSIGRLTMFVANIVAARILPQEVFGQFMTIRSTISMLEGLISGAIGTSATKHIAESSQTDKLLIISSLFIVNLIASFIVIFLVILFIEEIVHMFFADDTNMMSALYFGMLLLFSTSLSTMTQSVLIGFEEFKKLASISAIVSLVSMPIIFYLIKTFYLLGAITGVALYFLSDFSLKIMYLCSLIDIKQIYFNFIELVNKAKKVLIFSFPLFLAVVVNSLAFWYARIMLINDTKSFENIAIFDAAFQWLTIIMIITSATTSVALPMFSKAFSMGDKDTILQIFNINLIVNIVISLVIASLFIIISEEIMSLYGYNYIKGADVLIVLSITSIFFTLATLYNRFMMSINQTRSLLIVSILGTISLYVVLFLFGVSTLTLAWAFLAYYLTSVIYYFFIKWKFTSKYKNISRL